MKRPNVAFAGLIGIIAAAAAAVAAVFGLFNSVLAELVPPFEDSQQTVGFVSMGTVAVLLILTIVIQKRLTTVQTRTVAIASVLLLLASVAVYFPFRDLTRTYTYRHPPASIANLQQTHHIRGDLHERGKLRVRDLTIAEAVYQLGGPDTVNSLGTLWSEESRLKVIGTMERYYVALIMLLTTTIFMAGLTVWRRQQAEKTRRPARSKEDADAQAVSSPPVRIFLSYRRTDSTDITGRIYDRLVAAFGRENVFKDVDAMPAGVDFRAQLGIEVERADVVLGIIGPRWLSEVDANHKRRLDDVQDYVRIELAAALERGIPVIPVLVGGAAMPRETELPKVLSALAFRNAAPVRTDPDFHTDMDRLILGARQHASERR
jgi:TIR domain